MKKLALFLVSLTILLISCKIEDEKPTVITKSVRDITKSTAKVVGQVDADGGAEVGERGMCWNTEGSPTNLDFCVKDAECGLGSYEIVLEDLAPNTRYYVKAYATNEYGTGYGEEKTFTTSSIEGTAYGHDWVDLGLPSGIKWATCNVGSTTPEGYGYYYAWGETVTKTEYNSSNSATYGISVSQLQSQGYVDSDGNLTRQYDAAAANWGGDWRMPTKEEQQELLNKCTWTWTTQNGVDGYNVEGPSGASIFLPAAGYRNGLSLSFAGNRSYYWSSTHLESDCFSAYYLYFYDDSYFMYSYYRNYGQSVRPVME